jgi:hypothetical protein
MRRWFILAVLCAVILPFSSAVGVSAKGELQTSGGSGTEIRLRADLNPTAAGGMADGHADWRSRGGRRQFSIEVEDVQRDGVGRARVVRAGTVVWTRSITISGGFADLNLDTQNGQAVPSLQAGDVVQVRDSSGTLILRGTLQPD